jgi:PQQ-dependent catabolism-associated CXXCW motif protein
MWTLVLMAAGPQSWQQMPVTQPAYDNETSDYGLAPASQIRTGTYDAPTPTTIPGAKTVTTPTLRAMMAALNPPLLIDVLGGNPTASLPTAIWWNGAGLGRDFNDDVQVKLAAHLTELTGGDKTKSIVFFCAHRNCWLSVNASMRAVRLGYMNVYWYRGGRAAWHAAGLPMEPIHGGTF